MNDFVTIMTLRKAGLVGLLLSLLLLLGACGDSGDSGDEADAEGTEDTDGSEDSEGDDEDSAEGDDDLPDVEEGTIVAFDGQWESLWIVNAIFELIVEEGYGHDVETATTTTPIMHTALPQGDIHVAVELWCVNHQEWCDTESEAGNVEIAGEIFSEAEQGWFVPRYVIEGDEERGIDPVAPDLESVEDLPEYADVFEDPEDPSKGQLIPGITGWESTQLSAAKVYAYGLDEHYNLQEAGSPAALDAAIAGAYERGEPVLFYYWTPSWIPGAFDVVLLEEPEWTQECADTLQEYVEDEDIENTSEEAGCAFAGGEIQKGMYPGLRDMAPEVADFFERMYVGDDPINEAQAHMQLEEIEPEEAALWYFENFDDWRDWIEDDEVEQRVEDALVEQGVEL